MQSPSPAAAATGALDLPEILALLGPHLPRRTLLSCILVSRTWLDSFLPFLWHQVLIQGVHSVHADVILRRHAAHVREVVVWRVSSLKHFSNLERYWRVKSLKVKMSRKEDVGRVAWEKLGGLVAACESGLRDVVVEDCGPLDVFLVALGGGGSGERKKEYRRLLQGQYEREKELDQDSSEEEEESEGEDESGQEEEGEPGEGTLTATTPTTSTTSVNTTNTATTAVAPLSSPSIVTRTKRYYASSFSTLSPMEGCRLDTLVWKRIRVAASSMDHFWQASRGARDLTLECLTITGIDKNATTLPTAQTMVLTNDGATTYPSLRPIITNPPVPNTSSHVLRISWIMGLSVDLQLDLWIRPCQELRSLVWEAPSFPDPLLYRFARCLEDVEGSWSWLTSLEISACVAPFPSDAALARILAASSPSGYSSSASSYSPSPPCSSSSSYSWSNSSFDGHRSSQESDYNTRPHQQYQQYQHQRYHRWERLVFRTVGFGPLAFEALRRHFGTLKTLKWIGYAGSVTNEMAREVLESCPLLEDFYAPFLWVSDFNAGAVVEEAQGEAMKGQEQELQQQQQQQQQQDELDQGALPTLTALSLSTTTSSSTAHYPSPPLSPLLPPSFVRSSSSNTTQMQPWKCQGLQKLFISATSPNFFSPPLSKDDEDIIRTRLATLKELSYYCVGSTVFSSSFRHEY
ncbi:MAG: hypothetical protein J3R72DRAFT_494029 [Linnemannia gamsii]|nr:MAG: hypothetical protein J3R72DRAFT_494029 [Linnemannia gamsii]